MNVKMSGETTDLLTSHSSNNHKRQKLYQYDENNVAGEQNEVLNVKTKAPSGPSSISTTIKSESRREVILLKPKPYSNRMQKSLVGSNYFFPSI